MNIHLITYLTSKLFWIYTVFRYNTILYPKNEDTQKLFAYFCAYLLSCWGSMQWGTMYGDLIFELIALLIITVAYQADWQHHVWNTLMVYIMGILCDGIPIVFFQRYAVARNPVHHHMGPGTIVMGNFIFFLLEVIIERKVQGELTIMRIFSEYLQKEYSKIKSCSEIDREVLEEFLIHLSTKDTSHSANSSYVISLRRQLETIGKIYSYERLEHLFINTDIPPEVNAEFRVYSDDEMKRLNAEITQMDVQIARCLLIHQMLGTRISDTLTLRPDCLTRENGQDMIEIYQVKTKRYKKPISKELAKLLQSSIEYTQEKFGDTEYIFVNEKEPDRPMQYMAIKTKVMSMIQEKQLKDDHGELFGFGTHMFRHYYGVKLTEMHLDDWTIARLLGHKRLNNVQHYRKMSNQRMADETREVRQMMSDIIYMSLARWGEEYEQIRQDD